MASNCLDALTLMPLDKIKSKGIPRARAAIELADSLAEDKGN